MYKRVLEMYLFNISIHFGILMDIIHSSFALQVVNISTSSSSLYIDSADSNALLDNGVYTCHVRVTIAGVDSFVYSSGQSTVSLRGVIVYYFLCLCLYVCMHVMYTVYSLHVCVCACYICICLYMHVVLNL